MRTKINRFLMRFGVFFAFLMLISCNNAAQQQANGAAQGRNGHQSDTNRSVQSGTTNGVPAKAYDLLKYIRANGTAPDGYVGGRTFMNREKRLVITDATGRKIKYREWDVNPKKKGKNRGTERVITGSDESAYYTGDHYKTFTKF
jgi:ribonuclease T1